MFRSLANTATRRPLPVVAIAMLISIVALGYASGVTNQLNTWGFDAPGSEQLRALDRYHEAAGIDPTGSVVALIETKGAVNSVRGRRLANKAARKLRAEPQIEKVYVPFGKRAQPGLISEDGRAALVVGYLEPSAINGEAANRLLREFAGLRADGVTLGGEAVRRKVLSNVVEDDLKFAEMIALPVLFFFGLLVFRGLIAALVPLLVSAIAIPFALSLMRLADQFSDMSVYALNLVTGLGLGLAIDYSLLVVTRFREELDAGATVPAAVRATVETAGRTVFFSSMTVAGAAASLMIFPQPYLYSMGFGGMTVALVSAFVALLILPAALMLLGRRIDAFALAPRDPQVSYDKWYRWAKRSTRRPGLVTLAVVALVAFMSVPALNTHFATADDRTLPAGYGARDVGGALATRFDETPLAAPAFALVEAPRNGARQLRAYKQRAAQAGATGKLSTPVYLGDGLWRVDAWPVGDAFADSSQTTVKALRAAAGKHRVLVAGVSGWYVDQEASIRSYLPELIAIIALVTFIVLFMMTGSVVLPIKTFILNLATISAIWGLMVWIFQDGRFEGLLGFSSTGAIEITQPVTFFAITFGLTTDYGVFLLSRIKELHDAGYENDEAVAVGLARTGRVITAAALMLCVAVFTFALSRIAFVKATGIGIGLAVAFDATIIRALLVPSLMKLLGDYNWWAPGPLRTLHRRWGWNEAPEPGASAVHAPPPAPQTAN